MAKMGIVAKNPHQRGSTISAPRLRTVNVSQNILRSMRQVYMGTFQVMEAAAIVSRFHATMAEYPMLAMRNVSIFPVR
jgi:hypothetical protein